MIGVHMPYRTISLCLLIFGIISLAQGAERSLAENPRIRLSNELPGTIWRIDLDRDERFLVSASHQKSVAVWSLSDRQTVGTLRAPLRNEERKRAHGVAISPAGDLIAYGVPPEITATGERPQGTANIYIFDRSSSQIIKTIEKIPSRVQALAFSPKGDYLAATLSDGYGLRAWSTANWREVASIDSGYNACIELGECNTPGLDFNLSYSGSGPWLVTAGASGVKLYDEQFTLLNESNNLPSTRLDSAVFSPKGDSIAVGSRDALSVFVLSSNDLTLTMQPLVIARQSGTNDGQTLARVAWSKNGIFLYAGGRYFRPGDSHHPNIEGGHASFIVRWNVEKPQLPIFIEAGTDTIMDIKPFGNDNGIIYATQRGIGVYSDKEAWYEGTRAFDLRNAGEKADFKDFKVSHNGTSIFVESYEENNGRDPTFRFDFSDLHLETIVPKDHDLSNADVGENILSGWEDNERDGKLTVNSIPLESGLWGKGDISRSVAMTPDKSAFLWGTSDHLTYVDVKTKRAIWRLPIKEEAYRVNISGDSRFGIVGHADGTIRWYELAKSGKLVLSFYLEWRDHSWRWVAWVPDGIFATSNGARNLVGWQISHSDRPTPTFIHLGELFERYYDRDFIRQVLSKASIDDESPNTSNSCCRKSTNEIINEDMKSTTDDIRSHIDSIELIPVSSEKSPVSAPDWELQVIALNHAGTILKESFSVKVDGQITKTIFGKNEQERHDIEVVSGRSILNLKVIIPDEAKILAKTSEICVELKGSMPLSPNSCTKIVWTGSTMFVERKLWALVIGVSEYDKINSLNWADRDARTFAQFLLTNIHIQNAFRRGVKVIELTSDNEDPNKISNLNNIQKFLQLPEKLQIRRENPDLIKPEDVVLVFFSGHGISDNGRIALLPRDAEINQNYDQFSGSYFHNNILYEADIANYLAGVRAQIVLIFDSCRDSDDLVGYRFDPALVEYYWSFQSTSGPTSLMLSASEGGYSYEDDDLMSGVFTHYLLRALDFDEDSDSLDGYWPGKITVEEIEGYLRRRIPKHTRNHVYGEQQPIVITGHRSNPNLVLSSE